MKMTALLVLVLCGVNFVSAAEKSVVGSHVYKQELEALKSSPQYKMILDEEANSALKGIQRDIENYTHLTYFQRFVRRAFMGLDVFVVTPKNMPKLYAYIDGMCKAHDIKTPTIFLSTLHGFYNAAAQKLLISSGAIVIGQKLLVEASDASLEAIVAHEIGHIKHNHINKTLAMLLPAYFVMRKIVPGYVMDPQVPQYKQVWKTYMNVYTQVLLAWIVVSVIINKRFEKEADEFAYKAMDKGEGLVEFFEHLEDKDLSQTNDFAITHENLKNNYENLKLDDYVKLKARYGLARFGNMVGNTFKWIYHNTPLGAHPSPASRIAAARKHMK